MKRTKIHYIIFMILFLVFLILISRCSSRRHHSYDSDESQRILDSTSVSPVDSSNYKSIEKDSTLYSNQNDEVEELNESDGTSNDIEIPSSHFNSDKIIKHTGFTLSFNSSTLDPNWVAWELTSDETNGAWSRDDFEFVEDPKVPAKYRVCATDYKGSGYDRGHMCPAADMKWSEQAMYDCHYMTNMCPQDPELNREYWARVEKACRRWAEQEGKVYIICGPIFRTTKYHRLGYDHSVAIPDAFFKVVLSLRKGKEKAIGFYYENNESKQNMDKAVRSVDDIERITGMDFFPSLPDEMESNLESKSNLGKWN